MLPAHKLMVVPERMSDVEAAAFSLGAQTSYSMVRRAGVEPGANVLVTAATSNTSLFLAQAARNAGGDVTMTTSSAEKAERVRGFGFDRVFVVVRDAEAFDYPSDLADHVHDIDGFDAVLDPYFDLHLNRSVPVLASFGDTSPVASSASSPSPARRRWPRSPSSTAPVLARAVEQNVTIVANCLGSTADLEHRGRRLHAGGPHGADRLGVRGRVTRAVPAPHVLRSRSLREGRLPVRLILGGPHASYTS